jgi:hypothetical protein
MARSAKINAGRSRKKRARPLSSLLVRQGRGCLFLDVRAESEFLPDETRSGSQKNTSLRIAPPYPAKFEVCPRGVLRQVRESSDRGFNPVGKKSLKT